MGAAQVQGNPCEDKETCGLIRDCTGKADGPYADLELGCRGYYICVNESYLRHEMCGFEELGE